MARADLLVRAVAEVPDGAESKVGKLAATDGQSPVDGPSLEVKLIGQLIWEYPAGQFLAREIPRSLDGLPGDSVRGAAAHGCREPPGCCLRVCS